MKTRQEKIDAIYEKIADKTLSFGCEVVLEKVFFDFIYLFDKWKKFVLLKNTNEKKTFSEWWRSVYHFTNSEFEEHFKIIWHPVMIGDLMDYFEKLWPEKMIKLISKNLEDLFLIWKEKRLPLEDQSDECVDFVYDLIFEK